jgi:hypothetical protein
LSLRKPRSARQRRHSPFGPTCVSGRPQIAHVPTVGSRSIRLSVDDLFNSDLRSRSMPFSIKPVPFEWFPEGACTRPLSLGAGGITALLLPDFKLLRKSGSVLPRSRESLDPRKTADSQLRLSGSVLKPRVGSLKFRSGSSWALALVAFWQERSAIAAKNAAV